MVNGQHRTWWLLPRQSLPRQPRTRTLPYTTFIKMYSEKFIHLYIQHMSSQIHDRPPNERKIPHKRGKSRMDDKFSIGSDLCNVSALQISTMHIFIIYILGFVCTCLYTVTIVIQYFWNIKTGLCRASNLRHGELHPPFPTHMRLCTSTRIIQKSRRKT